MTESYDLVLEWPHSEPYSVIVTGTFDEWSSSHHMTRTPSGFTATIPVAYGTKIAFKFIVDGNWTTHWKYSTEFDNHGNINNIILTPAKPKSPAPEPEAEEPKVVPAEVAASVPAQDAEPSAAPKEEIVKPDVVADDPEVAAEVPIVIQPLTDINADSTNEAKTVISEVETSTHVPAEEPAVKEATLGAEQELGASPAGPGPESNLEQAVEQSVEKPDTAPNSEETSTPAQTATEEESPTPRPSTPPPQVVSTPSAPVTPIKTAQPAHYARASTTASTTPPSSIAPSTPKTQSTNPMIAEGQSPNGGEKSVDSSPKRPGAQTKRKSSFFGKIKKVFGSPDGKRKHGRIASGASGVSASEN